jgi:2-isopropylmalate synthase
MGYEVPDEHRSGIYQRFLDLADRKKEIFDEDLERMMEEFGYGGDSPLADGTLMDGATADGEQHAYRIDHLSVHIETDAEPEVRIRLQRHDGAVREEEATGDGPVEALYRAIDHAVDQPHTLVDYSIRSISEGADAQGEVEVRIRYGENHFAGRARNTDVIRASAEAYVDALNRLAAAQSVEFVRDSIMNAYNGE